MSLEYRVGDVFDRLAEIPDGSIDLIVTSPPFLALRSYLPADHPDKGREIGSEPDPARFIDTLLALSVEWGRVLAPHGSLCVELGDTYSGSGQGPDALSYQAGAINGGRRQPGAGWPLAKSLCGIPHAYMLSLVYGWNILDRSAPDSPAGRWRARNYLCWARPNPPVGALGDKFRPATSYVTVACRGQRRYFDLDAVRHINERSDERWAGQVHHDHATGRDGGTGEQNPAGAPPLDWHSDMPDEDGDWLWRMSTQPYKGSHYATFPLALPKRLVEAMCPLRVCQVCGKPSERIVGDAEYVKPDGTAHQFHGDGFETEATGANRRKVTGADNGNMVRTAPTLGWSDCGHDAWRTGVTLDPFAGSGTTLEAAQAVGRHAIGLDLDERNAELAQQRVGMFLEVS